MYRCSVTILTLIFASQTRAGEAETDLGKSNEVQVGGARVVLHQVARIVSFDGKAPETSFRVTILIENIGKNPCDFTFDLISPRILVPGTTDSAIWGRQLPPSERDKYASYVEFQTEKQKPMSQVVTWIAKDVQIQGKVIDIRFRVGAAVDEKHTIVFRNVPLE